jgi:hypothetical protein
MEPELCPHCGVVSHPADTFIDAEGRTGARGTVTCMGFRPFQDAQGRKHKHDPNLYRMPMRCEAGHGWVRRWFMPCWCGWPRSAAKDDA